MKKIKRKIKLSDLLLDVVNVDLKLDPFISGITLDSRTVLAGDLFLACKGSEVDGRDFISEAIKKGAVAVFCEDELAQKMVLVESIPIIVVPHLRSKLNLIAARFYDYPARKLTMIGVTGTNGKTSVTQYIAAIMDKLGVSCGVIGTLGVGFLGKLDQLVNTTPDPVTLHRLLFELKEAGAKAVAMEVSSQGLVQGRVSGIDFTVAIFTNLTCEHLDCHGTLKKYGEAKKILFTKNRVQHAIINVDDEFGRSLIEELKNSHDVCVYTASEAADSDLPLIKAKDIKLSFKLMSAYVSSPWGEGLLESKLLGRFNLSNLLAVVAALGVMKFGVEDILTKIKELNAISGRMQVFGGDHQKPLVVIDYAHTPDALEKVLTTLREYCQGALWCVFGCGGDRDRSKRFMMGQAVELLSDHVIITNDNPRTEDSKRIVDDILQGFLCPWAVEVEYDRGIAIEYAINNAKENDVILVAGKGSENYQIVGKEKLPFSDEKVVVGSLKGGDKVVY